jgi:hypothetical protein
MSLVVKIRNVLSPCSKAYQNMIGALRSPETKSTYTFRLVAFLTHMGVDTQEELLRFDQKTTGRRIIEYNPND